MRWGVRGTTLSAAVAALLLAVPGAHAAPAPCNLPAGAGGDWPAYGHDAANTRNQPAETTLGPTAAGTLAPAWVFSTSAQGDATQFNTTPVESNGCVYVGSAGGVAYALDEATGKLVWKRQVPVTTQGSSGTFVGSPAVYRRAVIYLVNQDSAPFAIALDRSTGAVLWRSQPITTESGSYTNASTAVFNGLVVYGFSAPEGERNGQGGFALLDANTGKVLKVTFTVPPADQAKGFAGGGLWSTPAYDRASGYAYYGAGNPFSRQTEDPNTNAILKVDLDRRRATFGQIVAAYKGNVDQYASTLQTLSQSPACAATDDPSVTFPVDDQACGQLDLDFGASPNLFTDSHGKLLVGDLQKSGVYHVAHADTMKPAWTALLGGSCAVCNAASTAFDGYDVVGVSTPGGIMDALAADDGTADWRAPIGDGVHYQSTSTADGVAYTIDGDGFLDAFDAASGTPILKRAISQDTSDAMAALSSVGVAIARHTVLAAADSQSGYVIAYRPAG